MLFTNIQFKQLNNIAFGYGMRLKHLSTWQDRLNQFLSRAMRSPHIITFVKWNDIHIVVV